MQGNFPHCLDGWTLLPTNDGQPYHVDSGGPTAYGVTRANWSRWLGRTATEEDMRAVTPGSVSPFYLAWFWNTIGGDELPHGIDLMVFDHGVLAGETTSVMHLQEVVRVTADGWIGPLTLAAVKARNQHVLVGMLAWRQETFYRSLPTFPQNPGWIARLDGRVAMALEMMK